MICKNCLNEYTGNFCPKCGAKTDVMVETETEQNPYFSAYENNEPKAYEYREPESWQNTQHNSVEPPKAPMYQPKYYNYIPQPPKKSSAGKVLSVIAIVLSSLAFIISCSIVAKNSDSQPSFYDDYDNSIQTENQVGETIKSGKFSIVALDTNTSDTYNDMKAKEGYEYLTVSFNVHNNSQEDAYFDCELNCYADKNFCKEASDINEDGYTYCRLPKDNELDFDVVFQVPKKATEININLFLYDDIDDWYEHTIIVK